MKIEDVRIGRTAVWSRPPRGVGPMRVRILRWIPLFSPGFVRVTEALSKRTGNFWPVHVRDLRYER